MTLRDKLKAILSRVGLATQVLFYEPEVIPPAPVLPSIDATSWSTNDPALVVTPNSITYTGMGMGVVTSPKLPIPARRSLVIEADVIGGNAGNISDWYTGNVSISVEAWNSNGTVAYKAGEALTVTPGLLRLEVALPEPATSYTINTYMSPRFVEGNTLNPKIQNLRSSDPH